MIHQAMLAEFARAQTQAVRRALATTQDPAAKADLLFLEHWEMAPIPGAAAALRVQQIRRANPDLAAALRAEVATAQSNSPRRC